MSSTKCVAWQTWAKDTTTGGELNVALRGLGSTSNPSWHRRAAKLVEGGHLERGPQRRCRVSGEVVGTYRLPGRQTPTAPIGRVHSTTARLSGSSTTTSLTVEVLDEQARIFEVLNALW